MDNLVAIVKKAIGLTGRILLGLYFVIPGISKVVGFAETGEYMAAHDVPLVPLLLAITIVLQIGGGAALIAGFRSQVIAFLLAGLTLAISLFMHDFWNMEESLERGHEMQNFVKNMAIMAGLMFVAASTLDQSRE